MKSHIWNINVLKLTEAVYPQDTSISLVQKAGDVRVHRNGVDLIEPEDIKKRWQDYTELYKKDLHDPDNHDGVITNLEPDILNAKSSGP